MLTTVKIMEFVKENSLFFPPELILLSLSLLPSSGVFVSPGSLFQRVQALYLPLELQEGIHSLKFLFSSAFISSFLAQLGENTSVNNYIGYNVNNVYIALY